MIDRRLRRLVEVAQGSLGPLDPVAVAGVGKIEHLVGHAQHLNELARGFALVGRGVVTEYENRIG